MICVECGVEYGENLPLLSHNSGSVVCLRLQVRKRDAEIELLTDERDRCKAEAARWSADLDRLRECYRQDIEAGTKVIDNLRAAIEGKK